MNYLCDELIKERKAIGEQERPVNDHGSIMWSCGVLISIPVLSTNLDTSPGTSKNLNRTLFCQNIIYN